MPHRGSPRKVQWRGSEFAGVRNLSYYYLTLVCDMFENAKKGSKAYIPPPKMEECIIFIARKLKDPHSCKSAIQNGHILALLVVEQHVAWRVRSESLRNSTPAAFQARRVTRPKVRVLAGEDVGLGRALEVEGRREVRGRSGRERGDYVGRTDLGRVEGEEGVRWTAGGIELEMQPACRHHRTHC